MEDLPGADLQARLDRGEHPSQTVLIDWVLQAADQIAVLHRRSPPLIHRDLKPHNLLLDDHGKVWLLDFGSVKQTIGQSTTAGTFGFMAPEQLEGRATPQSDVYGLGMTLMALLTRTDPTAFSDGVRSSWRSRANVSDGIAAVIDRAIALDDQQRFAHAAAFAAALRAAMHGRVATPAIPPAAGSKRGPILLATALAVMMGMGFVMFTITSDPSPMSSPPLIPTIAAIPTIPHMPPAKSPDIDAADRRLGAIGLSQLRECRNDISRLAMSANRYAAWRKTMASEPTCKERYVDYGLYALNAPASSCRAATTASDTIRTAMTKAADVHDAAMAPISQADRYYDNKDHRDDGCALGKQLHPVLLAGFTAGAAADQQLTKLEDELIAGMHASSDDPLAMATIEPMRLIHAIRAKLSRKASVAEIVAEGKQLQAAVALLPPHKDELPTFMGALRDIEPNSIVASMHWDSAWRAIADLDERLMARLR
jgi:hypothetical protein